MNQTVTVEEAIKKGLTKIIYPGIVVAIIVNAAVIFLLIKELVPFWIFPSGFVFSLLLYWLYWSITIADWKLWAFENVRNVHALKKRAIKEKLLYTDDSFLSRTEISNSSQKEKWQALQSKFLQEDLFLDDYTVTNETLIYYSKKVLFFDSLIMFACFAGGLYLVYVADKFIWGIFLMLIGAYYGVKDFKKIFNNNPQIIISNDGIETASTKFYKWKDIEHEEVTLTKSNRNRYYHFHYAHPEGVTTILLDECKISPNEMERLLKIYRGRNNKNRSDLKE